MNAFDSRFVSISIADWLKRYLLSSSSECFVVGVSGGIDSAVTSTLCALTGNKTIVVSMPILQARSQLIRADNHINWLTGKFKNVESLKLDLTNLFIDFSKLFEIPNSSEHAFANSRSRLRMVTLYQIAGSQKGLVVGTGNKVEDFGIGFYTKYGDGGVDISPIADLMKSEVRELAVHLGIIDEIIFAKPTDGLWGDDRTDEDQIGASYEELELAMETIENPNLNDLTARQKVVLEIFKKFNMANRHKMVSIPVFKLNNIDRK